MPGLYVMTASGLVAAATPPGPTAAVEAHVADTTDVHGIEDTADLIVEGDARLSDARNPLFASGPSPSTPVAITNNALGQPIASEWSGPDSFFHEFTFTPTRTGMFTLRTPGVVGDTSAWEEYGTPGWQDIEVNLTIGSINDPLANYVWLADAYGTVGGPRLPSSSVRVQAGQTYTITVIHYDAPAVPGYSVDLAPILDGIAEFETMRSVLVDEDGNLVQVEQPVPRLASNVVHGMVRFATSAEAVTGASNVATTPAGAIDAANLVLSGRSVIAGTGLAGGGTLGIDRTLTVAYGTTASTAARGNDSRITGAAQKSANLSDLADAATARTNLSLGSAALAASGAFATASHSHTTTDISNFTEAAQDIIGGMVVAAGGSYDDGAGTITLPAGTSTEDVQDIIGAMVVAAGGTYDDALGTITLPSGGASAYANLTDVDMTGLADGDVPVWNDTLGVWEPAAPSGGVGTAAYMGAKATRTTNQSIAFDTSTAIIFTAVVWDDGDVVDLAQPTRFTAPVAGKWNFAGYASFLNGESTGQRSLTFRKNGAPAPEEDSTTETNGSWSYFNNLQAETTLDLAAGDYVELHAYTDRAAGATVRAATMSAHLVSVPANVVTLGPTAWQSYTPVITASTTNPMLGTGGIAVGRYRFIGSKVEGYINVQLGTSGISAGSGHWMFSLPPGIAAGGAFPRAVGAAQVYDSSPAAIHVCAAGLETSGTKLWIYSTVGTLVNHATPVPWAANDSISLEFSFELASGGGYSGVDIKQHERFSWSGDVEVGLIPFRLYNTDGAARTIDKVDVAVGTAPTGAALIVDVLKNGSTIYPTTAKPQVAAAAFTGSSVPDTATWADGEYLTLDVTQVGSTIAGADMVVTVTYH